eukprot:m.362319 g.362319  ORF g.362319 m.362319 type:complete len:213 (+) comp20337_c0_seq1:88-726(+)
MAMLRLLQRTMRASACGTLQRTQRCALHTTCLNRTKYSYEDKQTWLTRAMAKAFRMKWITPAKKLEYYPPFWVMRIKVLEITDDWHRVRVKLPLNSISRNTGGVMFGGYQASLADPIAALACAFTFPDYACWTRAMTVDFQHGATDDLELRFEFCPEQKKQIEAELATRGRATPTFTYGFYLPDGTLTTKITNTVAIRPRGYVKAVSPPAEL